MTTLFGFSRYLTKVKAASGKKKVFYAVSNLILIGVSVGLLYLAIVLFGKDSLIGIIVGVILGVAALLCFILMFVYEIILSIYGFKHFGQKSGKANLVAALLALLSIVGGAALLVSIVSTL